MSSNFADGLSEEEFRRSIEARLRENRPEEAVARLRRLLVDECGPGGILPERFLSVCSADLVLLGWDDLADRLRAHDEPGRPITALSVAFAWPGDNPPKPDENGCLSPCIETGYFDDSAYPFSESNRDNLLEGYSYFGCTWAGEAKATEHTLTLAGIDDLHGALAALEAKLLSTDEPDEAEIRAGSLGACLLSVLLFQAVAERIASCGLPRPLCVMAGSNGVYPYFDAPVAGLPDEVLKSAEAELVAAHHPIPGPRYSSLLVTGIPRARKRAVLVIDETEAETATRLATLRNLHHHEESAVPQPEPELATETASLVSADGQIMPNPAGPLMVKRKSVQSWNLQDLLNPGAPPAARAPEVPPPPRPEPVFEQPPHLPEQPVRADPPEPPIAVPVEPGFISLGFDVESRLKALIATPSPVPALVPAPEPAAEPAKSADLVVDEPAVAEQPAAAQLAAPPPDLGPGWPFGLDWLEAAPPPVTADPVPPPHGLWARLRAWLTKRG